MFVMDAVHSTLSLSDMAAATAAEGNHVARGEKGKRLKRSELIEDIFNSSEEELEKKKQRGGERLNLSNTSRALLKEFQKRLELFLEEHSDLSKALESLWLPDDEYLEPKMRRQSYWMVRRLNRYWQWLKPELSQPERKKTSNPIDSDPAFLLIQKVGKDPLIVEVYEEFYHFSSQLLKEYDSVLTYCSYYYHRHPPAYRFN